MRVPSVAAGCVPADPDRASGGVKMPDLPWTEGPVRCCDHVDGTGKVFGHLGPCAAGMRGYVVQIGSE